MNRIKILIVSVLSLLVLFVAYEFQPARYHALLCMDDEAVKAGGWNSAYDGYYIGSNGCLYDPALTPFSEVPPVTLPGINKDASALWYINGANLRVDWVLAQMHLIAKSSGRPVIAIYNSTLGSRLLDAPGDALWGSRAVNTAVDLIEQSLRFQKPLYFQANSQGAMHMASILKKVGENVSVAQLNVVNVHTAGGASLFYPDGPRYIHLANLKDPVPESAGVLSKGAEPGLNAEIITFSGKNLEPMELGFRFIGPLTRLFLQVHGMKTYQPHFPDAFKVPDRGAVNPTPSGGRDLAVCSGNAEL